MLKFHFITRQFLLVKVQGLVVIPGAGYPRYAIDTHTTLFAFKEPVNSELRVAVLNFLRIFSLNYS